MLLDQSVQARAEEVILDRLRYDPDIFLSPVSLWEIAIKQAAGKLAGPPDLAELVRDIGSRERSRAPALSADAR